MLYQSSHRLDSSSGVKILVAALLLGSLAASSLPGSVVARSASSSTSSRSQDSPALAVGAIYSQTNLVSDLPGVALIEDRELANPWGIGLSATSPFWVVNNAGGDATLYQGDVSGSPLVINSPLPSVAIPTLPTVFPAPSLPTGVVANNTSDFLVTLLEPSAPAQFIFATEQGAINAWKPALGSFAAVVQFVPGHHYTGLAIGNNASGNFLYAADFENGNIDVFDKDFNPASVAGNFIDATVPANFHPYNIQNLGGALYVTYAEFSHVHDNFGFVRKFDTNGVRDAAFAINDGPLATPWGLALAPANFGAFSNLLLVANYRLLGLNSASINAFNPATGALVGNMVDGSGAALQIERLRGLAFGNGTNGGDQNTLYFTADIFETFETRGDHHGLFGSLKPVTGIPATTLKFSDSQYFTNEGAGHFDVTVVRTGDLSGTATVNYATVDSSLSQTSGFEIALGRLAFSPGESSKTFRILIVDNHLAGAGSALPLNLVLSNATGAALVNPGIAQLFVMDNDFDTNRDPINIIDDARSFVRQHYYDFLNREPDTPGLDFWTNQITSCGRDQQCIERKRVSVSAAFFLSIEFQKTGILAYLTERVASGTLPRYGPFMRDVQALQKDYVFGAPGAAAQLEANTRAFFDEFITRPEFVAKYGGLPNDQYVSELLISGGISSTTGRLFISRVDGSQVVPPVSTPATGVATARISLSSFDVVDFSLSFQNLSSAQTAAHLHSPALAGANAPEIVTLPNGEFRDLTVTLTPQQSAEMRNGRFYIDVHSVNNVNGEIRGQFSPLRFQKDVLVDALNAGLITRAQALRLIVEDGDYKRDQFNRAFVLMEYFGYLRRNPDDPPDNNLAGYNFWLAKLDQFNGNFQQADMVKAFIKSTEYRRRFGPP